MGSVKIEFGRVCDFRRMIEIKETEQTFRIGLRGGYNGVRFICSVRSVAIDTTRSPFRMNPAFSFGNSHRRRD